MENSKKSIGKSLFNHKNEINCIEQTLKKMSEGNFDIDINKLNQEFTLEEREQYKRINEYLLKIAEIINTLDDDGKNLAENVNQGIVKYRLAAEKYPGKYSSIASYVNQSYDMMEITLKDAMESLHAISDNDFTVPMQNDFTGAFGELSKTVEVIRTKMLYMQNCAVKIANGDTSEIDTLTKIGKRSEKDELAPAFLLMFKTVQALIDDTQALAIEAQKGNLSARGDANNYRGGYINIVNAINGTLDAVVTPIIEITEVMGLMQHGSLQKTIKGDYKGDYAKLTNSINSFIEILKTVIAEITEYLTKIANANINIPDIQEYENDFADISTAVNKLISGLNGIMKDIDVSADQVASGSNQIADTSVMLSQGSEEQASSIEEITSSITQMAAQIQQNAANATQADSLSNTAKESAVKGDEQMEKMINAMHDINESSNNISKIIKVIDDIAFQTNILALNAAVEAARAGQYGKGFAVVAEEVRNLAQKSASAAKETTGMIENSIEKVKYGTDIANITEKALKEIVEGVSQSAELVGQIASASNEQAAAIAQINTAIEQVSEVVQTNSATAEESASASEELTSQAEMLKKLVGRFILRKDNNVSIDSINVSPELLRSIEEMLDKKSNLKNDDKKTAEKKTKKQTNKPQIILENDF